MAVSVVMPALELSQETGKLVSWRKNEGDRVNKGELLLEVETDKAVVEIEASADGILAGVTAQVGDVVPVGQTIAWLVQPGEAPPASSPTTGGRSGRRIESGSPQADVSASSPAADSAPASGRISPKARRLAKEHGVDFSRVRGSGPDGEILAEDILGAVQSTSRATPRPRPAPDEGSIPETLSAIGRLMAERTAQSWTTVPHFFVMREIDARALVAVRDKLVSEIEKTRSVKPTHTDLLVALVARALRQHPRMNASWTGTAIRANPEVNIGLAMAVADGVVAAVIPKADTASIGDIAVRRRELTERARSNRLQPSDLTGATFTISNLGMYQVDAFTAIIVPPQAGILAVGAIANRVVPIDGESGTGIGVRPMMTMTLSCDHRVVDGARGAAFLSDVVKAVSEPEKWL